MYIYTHILCVYIYIYVYIYICAYMCIYIYIYACTYVYVHIYIYTYMYICAYIYMYMFMYICICMCIDMFAYIIMHKCILLQNPCSPPQRRTLTRTHLLTGPCAEDPAGTITGGSAPKGGNVLQKLQQVSGSPAVGALKWLSEQVAGVCRTI